MLSKKILAVLLCVVMVLSCAACAKEPAAETHATTAAAANNPEAEVPATEAVPEEVAPADPFGGYDEPITLTTIAFESLAQACPDGVDLLSNPWQDLWKSKGINVEYAAIATDSDDTATKLNMAIVL